MLIRSLGVHSGSRLPDKNGARDEVLKVPFGSEQSFPIWKLIVKRLHGRIVTRYGPLRLSGVDKVASGSYFPYMRAVGLKILKNKLSEYVRLAAGGETVLVTDRDRVVAELVPPSASRSGLLADALLADAVRKGWITPPVAPSTSPPPRAPIAPLTILLSELAEDRAER